MSFSILVVDDAPFMRNSLGKLFRERGWTVVAEAANGKEAIQQYASLKPDVVTMDITMPEMDGISAVKAIRQMDPAARIIMCSAMGQQAMVLEAIQAGARDFIVKPFQADRVVEAVKKAVSTRA